MMRNDTFKKTLVLGIIVLFISLSITTSIGTKVVKKPPFPLSNGKTLYVGSGSGNYTKIQDAIDNASDGDTIFVFSGIYIENVIVDKAIYLIGENKNTTIIDGGGIDDVVLIDGEDEDWATISGFTIQNSGNDAWDDAGIDIYTAGNTITGNIIMDNGWYGIYCIGEWYSYSGWNKIYDNFVINNEFGIFVDRCFYNEIYDNYVANNEQAGIYVGSTVFPTMNLEKILFFEYYNDLYKNTLTNNGEGIEIELSFTNVFKNNISNNNYGISVVSFIHCSTNYNNIYQNNINNNSYGIFAYSEGGAIVANNISKNNIISSTEGISIISVKEIINGYIVNNIISKNNFIRNNNSAYFEYFLSNRCNQWISNYWERARLLPKPIFGKLKIFKFTIPWIAFDWHPAKELYDIGV